jgi:TatD DNase family protein
MWTDSHCHVHQDPEPGAVLIRAREAGVNCVVCVGTGYEDSRKAAEIAQAALGVNGASHWAEPGLVPAMAFATVGLHPHDAIQGTRDIVKLLAELVELREHGRPVVVGVGECGLDYHYDHSPRDVQRKAFAEQVVLANRHDLPLVVHTREAWDDTFGVLQREGLPKRVVFHCFTGGPAEAEQCLTLGGYLSFSGIATFKNAEDVRAAAALCPLDRMLVETDSPFLTPLPFRGRRNEPMYLPLVGTVLAEAKAITVEELAAATTATAGSVFGIVAGGPA